MKASLPEAVASLGTDPRFGGSGLTTSMGVFTDVKRYSLTAVLEHEIRAQENDRSSQEVQAGLRVAAEELVSRIEQDLCRGSLQQAEGFVRRAIEVAQDRNVESLSLAIACCSFGLALTDDGDDASRGPVLRKFVPQAGSTIRAA